eukprot:TRINITY_DN47050_c0_g1_i1.p1 TRINITY_DN47050_c0_g1~~TRINITY_DN47050_c0_g1_i1.p1  ORF type:complete len:1076 (+),score=351.94 TRINITY_DN47050_c0_g1_i1:42-3230(+)
MATAMMASGSLRLDAAPEGGPQGVDSVLTPFTFSSDGPRPDDLACLSVVAGPGNLVGQLTAAPVAAGDRWTATFRTTGVTAAGGYVLRCTVGRLSADTPVVSVGVPTDAAAIAEAEAHFSRYLRPLPFIAPVPPKALEREWERQAVAAVHRLVGGADVREAGAAVLRELVRENEKRATAEALKCPAVSQPVGPAEQAALCTDLLAALSSVLGHAGSTGVTHPVAGARWSLRDGGQMVCSGGAVCEIPESFGKICGGHGLTSVEVTAAVVFLRGHCATLPGVKVVINAHTVVVPAGGWRLDTSGSAAAVDFDGRAAAPSGVLPSEPGADGEDGGAGGDAGDIVISCFRLVGGQLSCVANGGRGGAGQAGGDGAPGASGQQGMDGGAGGGGGKGGAPGAAGAAGRILVRHCEPPRRAPVLEAESGAAAAAARGGAGGLGGCGGAGVRKAEYKQESLFRAALSTVFGAGSLLGGSRHRFTVTPGAPGRRGAQGPPGDDGDAGDAGRPTIPVAAGVPAAQLWCSVMPQDCVGPLLDAAEAVYQVGNVEGAGAGLRLAATIAMLQRRGGRKASGVQRRAELLLGQLRRGFDYWGCCSTFIPAASADQCVAAARVAVEAYRETDHNRRQAAAVTARRSVAAKHAADVREALKAVDELHRRAEAECDREVMRADRELRQLAAEQSAAAAMLRRCSEDLTEAVTAEAVRKSRHHFGEVDAQDVYGRVLQGLAVILSVLPAAPAIAGAVAAATAPSRNGGTLASRIQSDPSGFSNLGMQAVSAAQGAYRADAGAAAKRTQEALAGVVAEAEQQRGDAALQEIDRWVLTAGLQGEDLRTRDAFLSAVRYYQAVLQKREAAGQRVEAMRAKCASLKEHREKVLRESGQASLAATRNPPPPPILDLVRASADAQRRCNHALRTLYMVLARVHKQPVQHHPVHSPDGASALLQVYISAASALPRPGSVVEDMPIEVGPDGLVLAPADGQTGAVLQEVTVEQRGDAVGALELVGLGSATPHHSGVASLVHPVVAIPIPSSGTATVQAPPVSPFGMWRWRGEVEQDAVAVTLHVRHS